MFSTWVSGFRVLDTHAQAADAAKPGDRRAGAEGARFGSSNPDLKSKSTSPYLERVVVDAGVLEAGVAQVEGSQGAQAQGCTKERRGGGKGGQGRA